MSKKEKFYIAQIEEEKKVERKPSQYASPYSGTSAKDNYAYPYVKYGNEGRQYKGLNKNEEIDETSEEQYIWQKQVSTIEEVPTTVVISEDNGQEADEFIKSVNHYKGYFKNEITNKVVYLTVKENKWSEEYTQIGEYTDKNGDTAYIPQGFRVSLAEGTNEIVGSPGFIASGEINQLLVRDVSIGPYSFCI